MTAVERDPFELDSGGATAERTLWLVATRQSAARVASPQHHLKRAIDIAVVLLIAPVALLLSTVIAVAVKCASPGPVLFKQDRVGRDGRPFRMLKFRTMNVDADDRLRTDPALYARYVECDFKLPADEDTRIVPFGRFLRRTSLDELPQLINVLRGDMSLVGPRPVEMAQVASYGNLVDAYLSVRPGLTGRWQTAGRSTVLFPERAQLDAEYVETWSLWQDVVILLKTVPCVLRRHGSH